MAAPVFVARSAETWADPWPMYAALRDHDPVHHVEDPGGDHWVLTRHADVFAAARDTATFSSRQGLTTSYGELEALGLQDDPPMVMLDPPEHTELRRLVGKGFTPRQVASVEPAVRAFVVERLEELRARGGGDVVAELFKPLPSMVVAHYLGVPEADRARFDRWTEAIVAANALGLEVGAPAEEGDPLGAFGAVGELFAYFGELIERRKVEPADDAVSHLVASGLTDDPKGLLAALGFAFTMVTGGNDTTTGMLGGTAMLLTERPDQRRILLDDPAAITDAVEELLRLTSPVQGLARTTTAEVTLHGTTVPAGRKVLLCYGAANRDPRAYGPDADELEVRRRPDQILTFSYGAHHCLGAAAARMQARVVIEELLARCPTFTVEAEAVVWAPGRYVRRPLSLPFLAAA
jgi:cytochrome P450